MKHCFLLHRYKRELNIQSNRKIKSLSFSFISYMFFFLHEFCMNSESIKRLIHSERWYTFTMPGRGITGGWEIGLAWRTADHAREQRAQFYGSCRPAVDGDIRSRVRFDTRVRRGSRLLASWARYSTRANISREQWPVPWEGFSSWVRTVSADIIRQIPGTLFVCR